MDDGWSPRLIAQMLARDHPDDRLARVSLETIYQCLYVQTRGSLRADLHQCLSTSGQRVNRAAASTIVGALTAAGRNSGSASARRKWHDRAVPGHWEGDLVRHEALCDRAEVKDLRRCAVAAA